MKPRARLRSAAAAVACLSGLAASAALAVAHPPAAPPQVVAPVTEGPATESRSEVVAQLEAVAALRTPEVRNEGQSAGALEGIDACVSLTGVVQHANRSATASGERESRASYRGDIGVSLPAGAMNEMEGKIFTHFRFGQGGGLKLGPTYTSTPNTTAFGTPADGSFAILAQAWYQLTLPLPLDRSKPQPRERVELTAGKMDPFAFFDQNAAADDETVRFLNDAFVHNPLLDSGGDIVADAHGFTPGARLAYVSRGDEQESWGTSLGIFASGPAADFSGSFGGPFVIAQLETTQTTAGEAGTYRAYVWTDGRASSFTDAIERHSGWGLSIDQRVDAAVTLFGRIGVELRGHVRFDRSLTAGAEVGGSRWGRGDDALGLAAGFLRTSGDYREATADGRLAGYAASGTERIVEVYYRWRLEDHVDLTPDLQWIARPGGDGSAADLFVAGVRARIAF